MTSEGGVNMLVPEFRYSLGIFLADLRSLVFNSQTEAGKHLGLDRTLINKYENDKQLPEVGYLLYLGLLVGTAYQSETDVDDRLILLVREINRVVKSYYLFQPVISWESLTAAAEFYFHEKVKPRTTKQRAIPQSDWGMAPNVQMSYGRSSERSQLASWVQNDQVRMIIVLGMGGMGKTNLITQVGNDISANHPIFWRTLKNRLPAKNWLTDCLQWLIQQNPKQTIRPTTELEDQLNLLLSFLREKRYLIIFDKFDAVLQEGIRFGQCRPGFEDYETIIEALATTHHKSCIMVASRIPLKAVSQNTGLLTIRKFYIKGFRTIEARDIFAKDFLLQASEETWTKFVDCYSGNPYALRLASSMIRDIYHGDVSAFLDSKETYFENIDDLLDEHFQWLTQTEKSILFWLALQREPLSLVDLRHLLLVPEEMGLETLSQAMHILLSKGLVETLPEKHEFQLLTLLSEYLTRLFVKLICQEVASGELHLFNSYTFLNVQAKDYLQQRQKQEIVDPIIMGLENIYAGRPQLARRLIELLHSIQNQNHLATGYAAGNLLDMLCRINYDLSNQDLSGLTIRCADFRGTSLPGVNLSYCNLTETLFAESLSHFQTTVLGQKVSRLPYEGMNITGAKGLTPEQKMSLKHLGALEQDVNLL